MTRTEQLEVAIKGLQEATHNLWILEQIRQPEKYPEFKMRGEDEVIKKAQDMILVTLETVQDVVDGKAVLRPVAQEQSVRNLIIACIDLQQTLLPSPEPHLMKVLFDFKRALLPFMESE
jgi:hypothetical protein